MISRTTSKLEKSIKSMNLKIFMKSNTSSSRVLRGGLESILQYTNENRVRRIPGKRLGQLNRIEPIGRLHGDLIEQYIVNRQRH